MIFVFGTPVISIPKDLFFMALHIFNDSFDGLLFLNLSLKGDLVWCHCMVVVCSLRYEETQVSSLITRF